MFPYDRLPAAIVSWLIAAIGSISAAQAVTPNPSNGIATYVVILIVSFVVAAAVRGGYVAIRKGKRFWGPPLFVIAAVSAFALNVNHADPASAASVVNNPDLARQAAQHRPPGIARDSHECGSAVGVRYCIDSYLRGTHMRGTYVVVGAYDTRYAGTTRSAATRWMANHFGDVLARSGGKVLGTPKVAWVDAGYTAVGTYRFAFAT